MIAAFDTNGKVVKLFSEREYQDYILATGKRDLFTKAISFEAVPPSARIMIPNESRVTMYCNKLSIFSSKSSTCSITKAEKDLIIPSSAFIFSFEKDGHDMAAFDYSPKYRFKMTVAFIKDISIV